MNILSYINNDLVPISPNLTVNMVCETFEGHTFTHMPVVENGFLLGNISADDVKGCDEEKLMKDYQYALDTFFVRKDTNWIDVLEAFAQNDANLMPVIDENSMYVGYYELIDIVGVFKETPFLNEPGGILIIEKGSQDYSFSEIAQIVESDDGRLLGAFISEIRDEITQITLKIGNTGLNTVMQTFRRYNYKVVSGNDDDIYLEDLKERSNYLKKFLNI